MHSATAIEYHAIVPTVYRALEQVHGRIDSVALPRTVHHLVQLRASQINACAYCVDMHTREARTDGETNERLDRLVVWRHVECFLPAERAALAWTEALTTLSLDTDYAALRAQLREHFSEAQIGALTMEIAMINLWNRINVSNH